MIFEEAIYHQQAEELPLTILFGHAHMAMTAADAVLVASGTATLEAALLKRADGDHLQDAAPCPPGSCGARHYLPYVGLPNILAGEFVVPEILQDDATPENLAQALCNQLQDKEVRERLEAGSSDPSLAAAGHGRAGGRGDPAHAGFTHAARGAGSSCRRAKARA